MFSPALAPAARLALATKYTLDPSSLTPTTPSTPGEPPPSGLRSVSLPLLEVVLVEAAIVVRAVGERRFVDEEHLEPSGVAALNIASPSPSEGVRCDALSLTVLAPSSRT